MNQIIVQPCQAPRIPEGVLRLDYRSAGDGISDWALAWPPDEGATWVIQIHGHGSHGDQLYTREDIRQIWLPQYREAGWGILTPNLRDNACGDSRRRSRFAARQVLLGAGLD